MQTPRTWIAALAVIVATANFAFAQQPFPTRPQQGQQGQQQQGQQGRRPGQGNERPPVVLPNDEKLLELHKTFVAGAEKLAGEYEKANQMDKARACYTEILRLVPTYTPAEDKMKLIRTKEATADRKPFDVYANKSWQDTGVNVIAGKPISIKAAGTWTFKMTYTLPPDGIEIPKELRDFPLGALVGKIMTSPTDEDAKVFLIGSSTSFTADRDGRLVLRIYDSDPDDNVGKISTYIEGTFHTAK